MRRFDNLDETVIPGTGMWAMVVVAIVAGCGKATPTKPALRATVVVPDGDTEVLASSCQAPGMPDRRVERVAAFEIEEGPVTCNEWKACVTAGACTERRTDECRGNLIAVGRLGATSFCGWHGRRLPTWGEWARAARGDSSELRREDATPCVTRGAGREQQTSCTYRSATGVRFELTTNSPGEWTSDDDCYEVGGHADGRLQVTLGLVGEQLARVSADVATFRCVTSPGARPQQR